MNDLQILYFLSAAEHLNFTKTAEEFYVSQPAVSRQIGSLETELNTILFQRNNNKIQLTEAGSIYYNFFKKSKQEFEIINEKTNMGKVGQKQILRIGWVECWDSSLFYPDLFNSISKCYPDVLIEIESHGIKKLEYLLKKGELDVIVTYDFGIEKSEEIEYSEICEIPKAIFYSKFYPIKNIENYEEELVLNSLFFVISDDDVKEVNELTIASFKLYGIIPRFERVKNIDTMIARTHNGLGMALFNTWNSLIGHNDFRYLKLNKIHDKIVIAWKHGNKESLISYIIEQMLDILN